MELLHKSNIILHVITGSIALILGVFALITVKGGTIHNTSGRLFLGFVSVVILTGLIGVFAFGRNVFLLVITVLSGYVSFSGYRVLKSKKNTLKKLDILVAISSIIVLTYFLYYFKSIGMIWSPIIIYSTVGALFLVLFYDFIKYLIPAEKYAKYNIWIYEHIYKMTSAFAALLSSFSGTVFEEYQPHSQYLPSAMGMVITIGFMIYVKKYGLKLWWKTENKS